MATRDPWPLGWRLDNAGNIIAAESQACPVCQGITANPFGAPKLIEPSAVAPKTMPSGVLKEPS